MASDRIEIALAADGGYFDPLFVTATSMAAYCRNPESELRFNILDGGIAADDWTLLELKVKELHPHSCFNRLPVDQERFAAFPAWNGNRMAYARLLLSEALPDVDWVLYSDCDFLWLRDVAELWMERDDSCCIVGVKDEGSWEKSERVWCAQNGYEIPGNNYVCSGMLLMNLASFRSENILAQCFKVMAIPGIGYPDQTAINIACSEKIKTVDPKWMRFAFQLTPARHTMPSVLHHAGEVPWKFIRRTQPLSDTMLLWHRFNARVRGISTWQSLRKIFTPMQIVAHRAIALQMRFPLTCCLIWVACKFTRHLGAYQFLKQAGVRYELPDSGV